jgi:hypothetical protein
MIWQICSGWNVAGVPERAAQSRDPLQLSGRLVHADTCAGHQDDARTHHQTLRRVMLPQNGFKTVAVFCRDTDRGSSAAGHSEQFPKHEKSTVQYDASLT